jgi:hypothetical protein
MQNKHWISYLNYGSVFGGNMTFEQIYPVILAGRTVKRVFKRNRVFSVWYFKLIDGKVQVKLPFVSDWEDYYFDKDDFIADNWQELSEYEKNELSGYVLEI